MAFVIAGRTTWSGGALIALGVAIAAFIFLIVGGVSTFAILLMILALAIAFLLG